MKMNENRNSNITCITFYMCYLHFWYAHNLGAQVTKLLGCQKSGGRLNKKDGLTRYGDSHVKDKTS